MQSDLNRPLGQNNKSKSKATDKNKPANLFKWLAGFAVVAIIGGASFTAIHQDPIESKIETAAIDVEHTEVPTKSEPEQAPNEIAAVPENTEQIQPGDRKSVV